MTFIELTKDVINIDDFDFDTKPIIEAFGILIEKKGFDHGALACGVIPSPDFGYFELADRFWRASLCVYSFGATNNFWERGVGYAEPWLFNARHAIELFVKGFFLNAIWLEEFQSDPHLSFGKKEFIKLSKQLNRPHNLLSIYNNYVKKIQYVISNWNSDVFLEIPEINILLLKPAEIEMLKEWNETDEMSFRFRYPSLKIEDTDFLQKINWHHDKSMLFPTTGLPKKAGYFFNHVDVMNNLHHLITELKSIVNYIKGYSEYQSVINDYWNDF